MYRRMTLTIAAAALAMTGLAGCTTITMNHDGGPTVPGSAAGQMMGNDDASMSDVMFAQMMIPHHEQAIEMSALAPANGASPEVLELAAAISAAQAPEINQMRAMLERWGVPMTMADHSGHGGMAMTGMVSDEDMDRLQAAQGADFDRLYLELMIAHHEGAIAMTQDPLANGDDPELRTLLEAIVTSQTAEIEKMRQMLAQS
ncbi:MAG: DUF305 domain-containing protein [Actinomycetota bacterium]|nr:DUF305 domain-containing protein [Actinomycetota bacterium]